MLSADLQCLADQLAPYLGDGMELKPQAVRAFHRVITGMAFQARALELQTVPPAARAQPGGGGDGGPGDDNVVLLWDEARSRRRGGHRVLNPIHPDSGGGAA